MPGHDIGGRLTEEGHSLPVRVYYEDTDFSGSVYHGAYVRFLERGRSDFLRRIGISHGDLAKDGLHFAVSEMNLSFFRAARIDDVVEVATGIAEVRGARVILDQAVLRGGERLVEARVIVALIDRQGRPKRFPDKVREPLSAHSVSS